VKYYLIGALNKEVKMVTVKIHGFRETDFHDAPYDEYLTKWKNKKADEYRIKMGLKETDSILISVS